MTRIHYACYLYYVHNFRKKPLGELKTLTYYDYACQVHRRRWICLKNTLVEGLAGGISLLVALAVEEVAVPA